MTDAAGPAPACPPGLRERKKAQTHAALVAAAFDAFVRRGYDATTTEEIATAAGVSPRTLFRHFGTKEDVALAPFDAFATRFGDAVDARPAGEAPLDVLVAAAQDAWTGVDLAEREAYGTVMRLAGESPTLLAAYLRRAEQWEIAVAGRIAARSGAPADDLRSRLVVAAFGAASRIAAEARD
ncbi:TetR/AcrR family transcriptional regulator, partial [Patulibacter sp. S7RM1-6]